MKNKLSAIKDLEARHMINTYRRDPERNILITRGRGSYVWDESGRKYLDFVSGLAVNSLGHAHPAIVKALQDQAGKLIHTSNLYYSEPQVELAALLAKHSFGDRVFLANSGAEANEAAIKLARKYSKKKCGDHKYKIITAERSFHGRTLATVTATAQDRYHEGFHPLPGGFMYARFNDIASFEQLVDKDTCAIMIEPIQGEAGVYPADADFLGKLRKLCDNEGILLIFDEVQCGMGRTGSLWAYEGYGVEPDIMTAAKALAGGVPIGAMIVREDLAQGLGPGDHASTFGGNPLACRVAVAVLQTMLKKNFLQEVTRIGGLLQEYLHGLKKKNPDLIAETRGKGLMLAMELTVPGAVRIQRECQEKGLLINAIGESIIRLLPPLIIDEEDLALFMDIFNGALAAIK
ncbi:MAG: aspartate aminotransferase family protein [Firmicutes bacterium]|jgi:predicted acetylornithine/succinylornithine family transaminase|nr:aspartate aminotransferase family protein [Bacillota bacterium]